ncbi:DUF3727 domain-containing protein [Synechococcus elongatus]|uniref:DUF3727 domain-containing protein n=1 Tax=Synechococcus elongatus PCC 11802 TaxID=2283154 RepID=A0AAT9JY92_SYNEL|nr:DUF3727 domain-containing protein [Synechococcus elongatus]QFZ91708.1 DUF3727 domain-containing protein [Synechococcus elongatus PCC 11802]
MEDVPTLLVQDDAGRTLLCDLEHLVPIDGQEYALLMPIDTPVSLFAWDDEDEDAPPRLVEDEEEIEIVWPTASAVLQEQNLTLIHSAVTLTVEGELPELEDEEDESDFEEDGEVEEEFIHLVSFYHEEQEYSFFVPLEPIYVVAKLVDGEAKLLSPEEFEAIEERLTVELDERMS